MLDVIPHGVIIRLASVTPVSEKVIEMDEISDVGQASQRNKNLPRQQTIDKS